MPFQIIETKRLYRQIADQLRELVWKEELRPGAKLPPERDLARKLGVSRPSVREALIALEVEGWIEVRKGQGIYICRRTAGLHAAPEEVGNSPGPLEVIRAREIIEGEVAAHAATSASKKQLAGLEKALNQMREEADAGRVPLAGDRLFHLRLAEATGNSVLVVLVTELFDHRCCRLSEQLGKHFENPANWRAAIEEHRQVLLALHLRSPERARAAMQRHMKRAHRRLSMRLA